MPINMFFIVKNHWQPYFTDNPRIYVLTKQSWIADKEQSSNWCVGSRASNSGHETKPNVPKRCIRPWTLRGGELIKQLSDC
jgi:hypothetical protein